MTHKRLPFAPRPRVLATATLIASFISFGRYDPAHAASGDLDPTFGSNGKVTTDFAGRRDQVHAIAIQPDGKIIVAGIADDSTTSERMGLARYNPDGSLDSSFGVGGKVVNDFGFGNTARGFGLALQRDGRMILAGVVFRSLTGADFALARYNSNGSLDSTFGSGGTVITDFSFMHDFAFSVALQPDGRIIAAGLSSTSDDSHAFDFALVRYNSDGSPDATFGAGGKVTTDFAGGLDEAEAIALQPDGRIVVAGLASNLKGSFDFGLARYNTDGHLDSSFGQGGKITTDFLGSDDTALAIALQVDGKIIAAGFALNRTTDLDFAVARYNADGSLDFSFGAGGKVTTDFYNGEDAINSLVLQCDGKIVAGGYATTSDSRSSFALARYTATGVLDPSFGVGGKVRSDLSIFADGIFATAMQHDGRIVAAGFADNLVGFGEDFALARYESGVQCPSFDTCLQDDSNGNLLQFNLTTGEYQFTNCSGFTIGGTAALTKRGGVITLHQNGPDRRLLARIDGAANNGTASLQVFSKGATFTITDRNTLNNTCSCGAQ